MMPQTLRYDDLLASDLLPKIMRHLDVVVFLGGVNFTIRFIS